MNTAEKCAQAELLRRKLLRVPDIMAYEDPKYLASPFLPEQAIILLAAYAGMGKSLVELEWAYSVLTGQPIFGHFAVLKQGPVLLLDEETPRPYLKDRLQRMRFPEDAELYVAHFSGLKLDREKDFETLQAIIEEIRPVLVFFDSLIRFHSADENSATEMAPIMDRLRRLANVGPTVVALHHLNKNNETDMRFRSRGSGDLVAGVDLEMAIVPADERQLCIQSVKARTAPVPPFLVRIEDTDGRLGVVYKGERVTERAKVGSAIRRILMTRGALTLNEIIVALSETGIQAGRGTVQRGLNELAGDLRVVIEARGKKRYTLRDSPLTQEDDE